MNTIWLLYQYTILTIAWNTIGWKHATEPSDGNSVIGVSFPSLNDRGKRMTLTTPMKENKKEKVGFKTRKPWKHDFCLLSDLSCSVTPSLSQLSEFKGAGLGRKVIVFSDKKTLFTKVKSVLETEYPKLKGQDGAFQPMLAESGGNCRQLCLIPIPPTGCNVPNLRETVRATTLVYDLRFYNEKSCLEAVRYYWNVLV